MIENVKKSKIVIQVTNVDYCASMTFLNVECCAGTTITELKHLQQVEYRMSNSFFNSTFKGEKIF